MYRSEYSHRGFTLIEILFATFIVLLVAGGIIAIYLLYATAWEEGSVQIALQREASTAMEKMVRGIGGTDGIREATSVNISSVTISSVVHNNAKIEFTDLDGTTRSFYLDDDDGDDSSYEIYYDPDTLVSNNEFIIAENVRPNKTEDGTDTDPPGFEVQASDNIITINLGVEGEVRNRKINVDLSTRVKIRNEG